MVSTFAVSLEMWRIMHRKCWVRTLLQNKPRLRVCHVVRYDYFHYTIYYKGWKRNDINLGVTFYHGAFVSLNITFLKFYVLDLFDSINWLIFCGNLVMILWIGDVSGAYVHAKRDVHIDNAWQGSRRADFYCVTRRYGTVR